MKRNYNILLLLVLFAFGSCSFTTKVDNDPNKDKLLVQIITMALEQLHFEPRQIDDEFSKEILADFIETVDPLKRFFLEEDINEFKKFETLIDDQLKNYDISFFNLVYDKLLIRQNEAKAYYLDIVKKPFDFNKDEVYNADYESLSYAKTKKELRDRWRLQLKFNALTSYDDLLVEKEEQNKADFDESLVTDVKTSTLNQLEEKAREETAKSLNIFFTDYIEDLDKTDWFNVYVNTIVEEFDPHTSYLAPDDKDKFDQQMSGKFEGIGARLQKRLDYIKIVDIISGGPAWRGQELEVEDVIMKVRQEKEKQAVNIVGMRIDDAIKLIKGPKGSKVILTVKKVDGTIKDISITRDIVELEETYAKSTIINKDKSKYGIINLPRFYIDFEDYNNRNAATDIRQEIERLKEQNIEGLILDLRNNGGGSLKTVVDIAGLFIKDGPIVQVRSAGQPQEVLEDEDDAIVWDGPLVIMVNELSASASEILAAAMQDYKRAIIIGSKQTYGKGTVQNVLDLNRMVRNNSHNDLGALKLTRQKFYRINGGSTQLKGVESDVVVPDRYSFIEIGERDQENPLAWDKIDAVEYKLWDKDFNYEQTISNSKDRMKVNQQLKLIEQNAKWAKLKSDNKVYSLDYKKYRANVEELETEAKQFDAINDFKNKLTFTSLPYETKLFEKDSTLKEKRTRWHENLTKDVHVDEAVNVLDDMSKTYDIKSMATIKN
jgi:carboxyl-terminal processing protease